MYRLIITDADNTIYKMFFNYIRFARNAAIAAFNVPNTKSVTIATKRGKVKFYQNKMRPQEVWIN